MTEKTVVVENQTKRLAEVEKMRREVNLQNLQKGSQLQLRRELNLIWKERKSEKEQR